MKKLKLLFLLILAIFLGLVIWDNWTFFSTKHALTINLKFRMYQLPEIENGLYLIGCFLIGFLVAYFGSLMARFRSKKAQKELILAVTEQKEAISSLKSEVEFLQRNSAKPKPVSTPESSQDQETVTNDDTTAVSPEPTVAQE